MAVFTEEVISLETMRKSLFSAVVSDALDSMGFSNQSPAVQLHPMTTDGVLVGRCKTVRWSTIVYPDLEPYKLILEALDSCQNDHVLVAATDGSMRSAIWGELMSTAARNSGCVGAIIDGAVRDINKTRAMKFPIYARGRAPTDCHNRMRVVEMDKPVEIGGVVIHPESLIFADADGIVVVPQEVEKEVIQRAWNKVHAENATRDAIRSGLKATAAYRQYGVL